MPKPGGAHVNMDLRLREGFHLKPVQAAQRVIATPKLCRFIVVPLAHRFIDLPVKLLYRALESRLAGFLIPHEFAKEGDLPEIERKAHRLPLAPREMPPALRHKMREQNLALMHMADFHCLPLQVELQLPRALCGEKSVAEDFRGPILLQSLAGGVLYRHRALQHEEPRFFCARQVGEIEPFQHYRHIPGLCALDLARKAVNVAGKVDHDEGAAVALREQVAELFKAVLKALGAVGRSPGFRYRRPALLRRDAGIPGLGLLGAGRPLRALCVRKPLRAAIVLKAVR